MAGPPNYAWFRWGVVWCLTGLWLVSCGRHEWVWNENHDPEGGIILADHQTESPSPDMFSALDTTPSSEQNRQELESPEFQINPPESPLPSDSLCTHTQTRACYLGPTSTQNQGICQDGIQTCDASGRWGPCLGSVLPKTEQCNGQDDDCNGWIDDVDFCVHTIAGTGTSGFQDGLSKEAVFHSPAGLVVSSEGVIYVADTVNQRIRKIDRTGQVSTYAGDGISGSRDGDRSQARFSHPGALALGPDQSLYVADTVNHRIRKITSDGRVSTWAGSSVGFLDGDRYTAKFYFPSSLAVDAEDQVYVADTLNHAVRKIGRDGRVSTLAGSGSPGYQDASGAMALFHLPLGIALGSENHLLIADAVNNMIRLLSLAGQVSTVAGDGSQGYRDGPVRQARFNQPPGIATDNKGNIYVADTTNQRIRKITPDGQVSTLAGTGKRGLRDGLGTTEAELFGPTGISVGPHNRLYFTDFNSHTVRVLQLPRP